MHSLSTLVSFPFDIFYFFYEQKKTMKKCERDRQRKVNALSIIKISLWKQKILFDGAEEV